MKDVSAKNETLRQARATAELVVRPETVAAVREARAPKGDVCEVARIAAIQAAKRTAELLPLCHPVPLDDVRIEVDVGDDVLVVTGEVKAQWKTGVEMEALVAVTTAALAAYDMLKPLDDTMELRSARLVDKRGGMSEFGRRLEEAVPPRARILTTSDRVHAGVRTDGSGRRLATRLEEWGVTVEGIDVRPDDGDAIVMALRELVDGDGPDLLFTTGGTGLAPRDVTVEATREVIGREVPGIAEAIRRYGQRRTPFAMLSRGMAGVRGPTLIVNLPGSPRAVEESLDALFPGLLHALPMLRGEGHG